MHSLSNGHVAITVASKGAELQSIFNHKSGLEYMWRAGREWPKKSPVLFPIVGGLKGNQYTYQGKTYHLSRHGFAREMQFELVNQTQDTLVFKLTDNETTLQVYPFSFSFLVQYTLHDNRLGIKYSVQNTGSENMYFSVGAHPAFAVPIAPDTEYEDYYLEFNEPENAGRWPLTADGLVQNKSEPLLNNSNILPLTKDLFLKDAIVFKHLRSTAITLKSNTASHGLKLLFDGFDYIGIWAAKDADFVCIEPWCGIADSADTTGNLIEKEGIQTLEPGGLFERTYFIEAF